MINVTDTLTSELQESLPGRQQRQSPVPHTPWTGFPPLLQSLAHTPPSPRQSTVFGHWPSSGGEKKKVDTEKLSFRIAQVG